MGCLVNPDGAAHLFHLVRPTAFPFEAGPGFPVDSPTLAATDLLFPDEFEVEGIQNFAAGFDFFLLVFIAFPAAFGTIGGTFLLDFFNLLVDAFLFGGLLFGAEVFAVFANQFFNFGAVNVEDFMDLFVGLFE